MLQLTDHLPDCEEKAAAKSALEVLIAYWER